MTPNKEDYLKCIYEISTQVEKISNKEIATRMQVSPPAVTEMMKKLIAEEFLVKDKKKGYILTEQGLHSVSDLYRKHRLIEVFLVKNLGYTTDEIHEEAEVLEHTISDRFVEGLDRMLDYPKTCPHGGTIPAKGEQLQEIHTQTLAQTTEKGHYLLHRVQDSFELLKYLEQINLQIGDSIELTDYDSFTDLYSLTVKGQPLQINHTVADSIYVEKWSKENTPTDE
ncbi:Mn-dependent transcriptional regulator MntR [Streptococcus sp. DD10]|uniref:metal-dependent transcriptional regulator n=1 Tax=Streptococcus sp. DD10 TaxID=1777878 RepID=UPI000797E5A9|nr:metal-dependent transcriptional regulator [Streptococcus sp. DD10]KXT73017.1 Mn-dependent transcriptional regulator MntR [Streptococcus sp. DD10]